MDPFQLKTEENSNSTTSESTTLTNSFKKPLFIGKLGHPQKYISPIKEEYDKDNNCLSNKTENPLTGVEEHQNDDKEIKKQLIPYEEPVWSGLPESTKGKYQLEVLKNGTIVDNINLTNKSFVIFGRLPNCDIPMAHPTISRYHAVLQYRFKPDQENSVGFYIYDLSSTHGTFLNKSKIRPRVYARVKVGYMIKLGCSTRNYILVGPEEDADVESELSITELKQKRLEEITKRKEKELEERIKEDEKGIDWGMGDDANDEADISENPYAQTSNEHFYIDDPKKCLRGFMEREGLDLEYDCKEQGFGQFLCRVELPIDDEKGRPIVAEVLHKGKKKEAVVQCAFEACRILDRFGVLRQATHESRKRKTKDWEKDDYYDSDDDTFLDRTGVIEKKRERRMLSKISNKPETYETLLEKEKNIMLQISEIEENLNNSCDSMDSENSTFAAEEDPLDVYMKDLKCSKPDKLMVKKLKSDLLKLKKEQADIVKLINIAKPADLPPLLIADDEKKGQKTTNVNVAALPLFGKRKKVKLVLPQKQDNPENCEIEESDEHEDKDTNDIKVEEKRIQVIDNVEGLENKVIHEKNEEIEVNESKKLNKDDEKNTNLTPIKTKDDNSSGRSTSVLADSDKEKSTKDEIPSKEKKKKNQKREEKKQIQTELKKQKEYEKDAQKSGYDMWVPPVDQTGDGRTNLNDKFGY